MSQLPEQIRQSELLNQVILDRTTTAELGRVEVLWMYVPRHRILGLVGKSGLLGNKKFAFRLDQVQAIGEDGIVMQGQPEATTPDRVKQLESLMHHEVWTDGGERLGKVIDCVFNLKTGKITHYLFVSSGISGILGSIYQVAPGWISSIGDRRILLSVTATVEPYQESLPQKITKTAETLKSEAVQEWRSITQKATGQFEQIRSQVKERTQEVSERLREEAQTLAERAKEQSQVLAEQVKEQGQIISKQLESGIQTLTVQAEEIFDRSDEPETLQYSYKDEDFDWDWDELNEPAASSANDNPEKQSASSRRGFNEFVDRVPPRPAAAKSAEAIDPNPFDSSAIDDDFDFDDDFWSDEPKPDASKPGNQPQVSPEKRSPAASQVPEEVITPAVNSPADLTESVDLDDEPWI